MQCVTKLTMERVGTNLEDNAAKVSLVSVQRFCQFQSFLFQSEYGVTTGKHKVKGDVSPNLTYE